MGDQPDFAALARQYLDLWEDQLTAMAADPDLSEQSARFFEAMTRLGKDANPMLSANLAEFLQRAQTGNANAQNTSAPTPDRTETATPAPGDRDDRLDQLARRLAAVEERLNRLESAGRKPRGRTTGGTRKKPAGKRTKQD